MQPDASAARFRAMFESEFSYVFRSLRRLSVAQTDLEDITHDVFMVVLRHLSDYDPNRPLRPWLFGITFRVALDYRRRARNRLERVGVEDSVADGAPPADEQVSASQTRRQVARALESIDLEHRAVLVMHDIEEHTMPEIAAALGLTASVGYSRLYTAREKFRVNIRHPERKGEPR